MANPKSPHNYPSNFYELVRLLRETGDIPEIRAHCTTYTEAENKRAYFSGFRSALKHEASLPNADREYWLDLHRLAKRIKTRIEPGTVGDTCTLVFYHHRGPDWFSTSPAKTTAPAPAPMPEIEEDNTTEILKYQRETILRYWRTRLMFDPSYQTAEDDYERLRIIRPHHKELCGVDIKPIYQLTDPQPLENLGI